MPRTLFASLVLTVLPSAVFAQAKLTPDDVPPFQLRARVVSVEGKEPGGKQFTFKFSVTSKPVSAAGKDWSDWLPFGPEQIASTLKGYPALYMRGYPAVVKVQVGGVIDPTVVEMELKFDGSKDLVELRGELFGPTLGVLLSKEDGKPGAATMAEYSKRYWKHLETVKLPVQERPKKFPIVDRFIGGDDDRRAWEEGRLAGCWMARELGMGRTYVLLSGVCPQLKKRRIPAPISSRFAATNSARRTPA